MKQSDGLSEPQREQLLAELGEAEEPLCRIEREVRRSCGPRSLPAKAARKALRSFRLLARELRSAPKLEHDAALRLPEVRQGGRVVNLERLLREARLERLREQD